MMASCSLVAIAFVPYQHPGLGNPEATYILEIWGPISRIPFKSPEAND